MIQGIKHIIFDLGGVLLNIDYDLTEKAFREAGIEHFNVLFSQLKQTDLFDRYETGRMTSDEFVKSLQQASAQPVSDQQIITAWNAMLLDFPLRRLQILQQLRPYYSLLLLSNTNEMHEEAFNRIIMQQHGIPSLAAMFDRVYFSHRIGMRKPEKEVFRRILEENGLAAEDTLFIDDSPQHIAAARELGIRVIHLEKGMTIEEHVFRSKGQ